MKLAGYILVVTIGLLLIAETDAVLRWPRQKIYRPRRFNQAIQDMMRRVKGIVKVSRLSSKPTRRYRNVAQSNFDDVRNMKLAGYILVVTIGLLLIAETDAVLRWPRQKIYRPRRFNQAIQDMMRRVKGIVKVSRLSSKPTRRYRNVAQSNFDDVRNMKLAGYILVVTIGLLLIAETDAVLRWPRQKIYRPRRFNQAIQDMMRRVKGIVKVSRLSSKPTRRYRNVAQSNFDDDMVDMVDMRK